MSGPPVIEKLYQYSTMQSHSSVTLTVVDLRAKKINSFHKVPKYMVLGTCSQTKYAPLG